MSFFEHSRASLRIVGDSIAPDQITKMLGCDPTWAHQKGEVTSSGSRGVVLTAKAGMWRLEADLRRPADLCSQIDEIFGKLTSDLSVWKELGVLCKVDLFCGLFMGSGNDGISIGVKQLLVLAERGIELALDIYDSSE